jgi:hypothetical protein
MQGFVRQSLDFLCIKEPKYTEISTMDSSAFTVLSFPLAIT